MAFAFRKISRGGALPSQATNTGFLVENNWDDFGFKTLFYLTVFDETGVKHDIGSVKIGYTSHAGGWTTENIPKEFEKLEDTFFSLGQDAEYYQQINRNLPPQIANNILEALRDLANNDDLLATARDEQVFSTSLLRNVSLSAIQGQFKRILSGGVILTEFHFSYKRPASETKAEVKLEFHVEPNTSPPTNIHILIGRNGVGKTTILNNMISTIINNQETNSDVGKFYEESSDFGTSAIPKDYFSSVTSLSFSAFDPFVPPLNRADRNQGTCYFYIGLKETYIDGGELKSKLKGVPDLCIDFLNSLKACFSLPNKKERWLSAIQKLESDLNFAEMDLKRLIHVENPAEIKRLVELLFADKLSSGHAIVLLSITKLIETVEEGTLVLIDEPESHLHPPLLSAFIRALSELLINRNGVAIIATHSPVVLQEVPKSCVWKLRRTRLEGNADRPESETFAENVGVLTREVFGLEVVKSGFHNLLEKSVAKGKSYEQILDDYDNQLGFEGRAVLRALVSRRDSQSETN